MDTVLVMEKKGMPSHLQSLPCVETPSTLATVIRELEDAGEACDSLTRESFFEPHPAD